MADFSDFDAAIDAAASQRQSSPTASSGDPDFDAAVDAAANTVGKTQYGGSAEDFYNKMDTASDKMKKLALKYGGPAAGSLIAGALTGGMGLPAIMAGQALGSAAGEAYGQIAKRLVGQPAPQTSGEAAGDIAVAGAGGAAGALGTAGLSALAKVAKPVFVPFGAQVMKAIQGIPEKYGSAALNDLSALSNAPSKAEVSAGYEAFEKYANLKGLGEQIMDRGESFSPSELEKIVLKTSKQVSNGIKVSNQDLYTASQAANKLMQFAKYGEPQAKSLVESGIVDQAGNIVDDALEKILPEYQSLRRGAFLQKMAEQFKSILPLNKNLSPNVLRTMTALGAAGAGLNAGQPAALLALPAISPAMSGLAIRGLALAAKVAPKAIPAAMASLMAQAAQRNGFTLGQSFPPDQLAAIQAMKARMAQGQP